MLARLLGLLDTWLACRLSLGRLRMARSLWSLLHSLGSEQLKSLARTELDLAWRLLARLPDLAGVLRLLTLILSKFVANIIVKKKSRQKIFKKKSS